MAAPINGYSGTVTANPTADETRSIALLASFTAGVTKSSLHHESQIGSCRKLGYHASVIHLRVPGTLRYRDLAVRVVGAACKLVGIPDEASGPVRINYQWDNEVISAFGEAFNNAAIHSYRGGKPGDVDIEVDVGVNHITIRLLDFGNSFDLANVPAPDLDTLPESGLGLFIIRSFMDDVKYLAGTPNVLSMTKYLDPARRPPQKPSDSFEDSSGGDSRQ
jgi:serine/threonine-protein kinase RsbW